MAILNNNPLIGAGGQQGYSINNSLRFRSSASAYLNRTPASAGNRRTFTWSAWIKRGSITANSPLFSVSVDSANFTLFRFGPGTTDKLEFYTVTSSVDYSEETVALFRDPSAWYHIVLSVDTTQATAGNRLRIYVNGVQQTTTQFYGQVPQNYDTFIDTTNAHNICRNTDTTSQHFDGYLADVNFIDGSAKTPSDFGETDTTTGVWKPKAYSGTYGTNGFYLKFSDIATTSGSNAGLGKDFSGNSNYWTTNNISVTSGTTYDAMTDSPTNTSATVANYATWNPLERTAATYSEANLKVVSTSAAAPYNMTSTIQFPTTGKWYCEVEGIKGASNPAIGMGNNIPSDQFAMYRNTGVYLNGGISGIASSGTPATWTTGDIIGIAYDASAGTLSFYKNGTLQSGGFTSIPATGYFVAVRADSASGDGGYLNCGQRPFAYTPPTGFVALNTYNLPTSTIVKGNTVMDATLYTGTGSSLSVTNTSAFKPDFVWVKGRSGATDHALYDSVRGTTIDLVSNSTAAETTQAQGLTAFGTGGFTVGTLAKMNTNGATYVGWQWQAGQGSTSSNTSGSITSTVSVNTTAGFSVVTYTGNGTGGATVGHGLGVTPSMIIIKRRSNADNWYVYHSSVITAGATNKSGLILNSTGAVFTNASSTTLTSISSSTFGIGTDGAVNFNAYTFVAYCWAEIAGFSKFGSYTGNGSADGPFVYLGFRPKFVLIKYSSGVENWAIWDTSRNTYNVMDTILRPDSTAADTSGSTQNIDFVSNGFKIRGTDGKLNTSSGTYIYAAFAENPFKNANAR